MRLHFFCQLFAALQDPAQEPQTEKALEAAVSFIHLVLIAMGLHSIGRFCRVAFQRLEIKADSARSTLVLDVYSWMGVLGVLDIPWHESSKCARRLPAESESATRSHNTEL